MKTIKGKLTYANVMATVAVFIALGGASYAALKLPKNSVGTKQIRNSAITAAKIKKGAVTGAKINLSTLGTVPSATRAFEATSATNAVNAANAAAAARAAEADGLSGPLASGKTLVGTFGLAGETGNFGNTALAVISFPIPLATAPTFNDMEPGESSSACPGAAKEPKAAPGNLCLYDEQFAGTGGLEPVALNQGSYRFGMSLRPVNRVANSMYEQTGVWAVTAP